MLLSMHPDNAQALHLMKNSGFNKKNPKILLLSHDTIDRKAFNEKYESSTWETCSLRTWMNNVFINSAFTKTEQKIVPSLTISTLEYVNST